MSKIFGIYLPYHKSEFFSPSHEKYDQLPSYPKQFRRVRIYKTAQEQLAAFANTMCPASQTFTCDETEINTVVADFDDKFVNEKWLEQNIYPYL